MIPGSGRCPRVGNGNQVQYSCPENPMDRVAWWATVHGVTNCQVGLNHSAHTQTRPRELGEFGGGGGGGVLRGWMEGSS